MLALGGGLSPSHLGRVQAVEDVVSNVESRRCKVSKVVIALTPDKLLKAKLGDQTYSLADRAELARRTFPKRTKLGVPIEAHTSSAEEAEARAGQPRRTQMADW